ncbi:hypothetical protein ACVILK_005421 [Bradyrhizobium embrapense]
MDVKVLAELPTATTAQQLHFETFGFVQVRQVLGDICFSALVQDYGRAINSSDLRLPFNELGQAPAFIASCMSEASPSVVDFATGEHTLNFAEALLGRPVVCVQAFAYQRSEDTRWHSDNIDANYRGLKLYLNLDAVDADSGALRVIVGSHHDLMRGSLIPRPYETAEQQFGVAADELPATILSSQPGDVSAFDLRIWHAVCGTRTRRRVIELTYYEIPQTSSERAAFVAQMQAHQRQARISRTPYYPQSWRRAGGPGHQRGLKVLAQLDLLETGPHVEGP